MKGILLFIILLPLFSTAQQASSYQNLVFEGGGIRGLAYAGAIKALGEKGILQHIERTAGSSVGAVAALLISLDYSATEIDSLLSSLTIQSFNDGKWIFIGGIFRMRKNYGWYRGNEFENWIRKIISNKTGKPDLSFEELHQLALVNKRFKDFYCTGTNLSLQRAEVFCFTNMPAMKISTAVRVSVSIPLYFGSVFLNKDFEVVRHRKEKEFMVYVDGGLLANYPLNIFDHCDNRTSSLFYCDSILPNAATLGIKLERPEQISFMKNGDNGLAPFKINGARSYISALYNVLFETVNRQQKTTNEMDRTIYISTSNISPRIRKLKNEDKNALVQNGYKGVQDFFINQ